MRSWIHKTRGRVVRQAHVGIEELGGLHEDLISREGFLGQGAELYRRNEPTGWKRVEGPNQSMDIDGSALTPTDAAHADGGPLRLFHNSDASIWVSRRVENMTYSSRNVDGDELYFVHEGTGTFYTEFGPIPYEPGDYVLIPKGITYRVRPQGPENYFLILETTGALDFADIGPIGRNAPFDPSLIYVPDLELDDLGDGRNTVGEWAVRIKARGEYLTVFYDFDPIDTEGWKGDLFPFKINIRDYRPISSERLHLMPSAHAIFQAEGVLVANFLPRPAEGELDVARIPPYHRNVDFDEFTFAHGGSVLGESIALASMTYSPQGLHHGFPAVLHEHARRTAKRDDYYDMKVIGIDTVRPLVPTPEVAAHQRHIQQILEGVSAQ
ncbi:homogentisate 1,2-dioxygenase [Streptomyces sp. NPDC004539]|uniref:homogentisate 1,2-dioxygenase n=1 Tax=Streptomyces sp. NPDC004539 TaxID=3154280 RepID=UPI0033AB8FC0